MIGVCSIVIVAYDRYRQVFKFAFSNTFFV